MRNEKHKPKQDSLILFSPSRKYFAFIDSNNPERWVVKEGNTKVCTYKNGGITVRSGGWDFNKDGWLDLYSLFDSIDNAA